mgnify:CR=1 FL=1
MLLVGFWDYSSICYDWASGFWPFIYWILRSASYFVTSLAYTLPFTTYKMSFYAITYSPKVLSSAKILPPWTKYNSDTDKSPIWLPSAFSLYNWIILPFISSIFSSEERFSSSRQEQSIGGSFIFNEVIVTVLNYEAAWGWTRTWIMAF